MMYEKEENSMSLNPRKLASDIANGLVSLNPVALKRYLIDDVKALLSQLTAVERKTRATQIPQEDTKAGNTKNRQLQLIHHAIMMINAYVKKLRLRG
jgi:hypothetical protein